MKPFYFWFNTIWVLLLTTKCERTIEIEITSGTSAALGPSSSSSSSSSSLSAASLSSLLSSSSSSSSAHHHLLSSSSALAFTSARGSNASAAAACGGYLTAANGIIQTPNFPERFNVPISCTWIIDASSITNPNVSIVVYLTQQYVLSGLKFTEYMYYSEDYKVPSDNVFALNEDDVTKVPWVRFSSPYLEIKFTMDNLYGTHLRALDRLLDVYGFNITYEFKDIKSYGSYQCSALQCRFLGNCYATHNFS